MKRWGPPAAGERGRLDPRESGALVRDRRWGEVDLEPSQHPLSEAVQVLDYYHCSEHVHKVGPCSSPRMRCRSASGWKP